MTAPQQLCPSCGAPGGSHGLVHVRNEGGGGGHNVPCPRSSRARQLAEEKAQR